MRHATTGSLLLGLAVFALTACGGAEPGPTQELPPQKRELPQPVLQMVAPTAVSAGDVMTIFGQGFADAQVGQTRLLFTGVFQGTSGNIEPVNLEVTPVFKTQGQLEWTFGPNIPFSPRAETGTFRGTVSAVNVGLDGSLKHATPLSTQVQVRPSILIKQLRPVNAGCAAGITDTLEDSKMLLEVEAIGLKAGNGVAPLRFVYTFLKQHFQFEGYFGDTLGVDPEGLFPKTGAVSLIDDVQGTVSRLGSGVPSTTYVSPGPASIGLTTGLDNMFKLLHFKTAPLPNAMADSEQVGITIMAVDSTGQTVKRTLSLKIWAPIEVQYEGAYQVAQSYDPVPVSGCIDGGDIGRDVTYTEMSSETRSRGYKFTGEISGGFDIKVARLNASFGIEVNGDVSSSQSTDLRISGKVLPNEYGVFYRQTLKVERSAKLRAHGPCGSTSSLGQVVVTDWIWSPDLAKGHACPPLPPSNLAPGQIFK